MSSEQRAKQIKKETELFFEKLSFEPKLIDVSFEEEVVKIDVKIEDPQILIGQGGIVLNMIQGLLYKILKRKTDADFLIDLDINEYKKKKFAYLRELANSFADEVVLTKQEKELEPMPAYQRRIIHLELAKRKDVITESVGEEPQRKVIIKPAK
ncbi:hypothetical protein J7L09_00850 [bacterium]|nr:hypothetical protein [bacterium]